MTIEPSKDLLLIKKHLNTQLKSDIIIEESDEDKKLITGEVIKVASNLLSFGPKKKTVIFGPYALMKLTINGDDFFFLHVDDVVGTCSYREDA